MNKKENAPADKYRTKDGQRKIAYRRFKEGVDYEPVECDELAALYKNAANTARRLIKTLGRPPVFEKAEELLNAYIDYLEFLHKGSTEGMKLTPGVEGFSSYIGITRGTLNDWERNNYKNFSPTIKWIKNNMADLKMVLGRANKLPALVLAMDMNNNHGYTTKQEVEVTAKNALGVESLPEDIAEKYPALPE